MKKNYYLLIFLLLTFIVNESAICGDLIPVKVSFLESFNIVDSTASQRYVNAYNASIYYALGENEKRLNSCGYKLQAGLKYFSNSNLITATHAANELEREGTWLIVGPTKSDQFLMAAKGITHTPMVSLMAESSKVMDLKPSFFTASPGVTAFVEAASTFIQEKKLGTSYGSFIDASCSECKDFEREFDKRNNEIFSKSFSLDTYGDKPDLSKLFELLKVKKIDFLLIPNYSKSSGYVISQVHKYYPNIKFIGSNGWGQSTWSFIPGYDLPSDIDAYTFRPGLSDVDLEKKYKVHSLNILWKDKFYTPPHLSYLTLMVVRQLVKDICESRPADRDSFIKYMLTQKQDHFRPDLPMSIYQLQKGLLQHVRTIQNKTKVNKTEVKMITLENLVGQWKLDNFEIIKKNGTKKPWGRNMRGLLIYTPDGFMSVSINKTIEGENPKDTLDSILFYSGTFEINDNQIVHHVNNASDPNRIGKDLIREVTLVDNKIELVSNGDFGTAVLTWERITKDLSLKNSHSIYTDSPFYKLSQDGKQQSNPAILTIKIDR